MGKIGRVGRVGSSGRRLGEEPDAGDGVGVDADVVAAAEVLEVAPEPALGVFGVDFGAFWKRRTGMVFRKARELSQGLAS